MQAMSRRAPIGILWKSMQTWLFPVLEDKLGELDEKHRQFVSVCELCAPQDHMAEALAEPLVVAGFKRKPRGVLQVPQIKVVSPPLFNLLP